MLNIKKTLILSLLATLPMQATTTSNPAMVPIISYLLSDSSSNIPPIADAGDDKTVVQNQPITIETTASYDADGRIVSYQWKQNNIVLGDTASFTHTFANVGTKIITLTVTDNDGATHSDSMHVVVTENSTPALTSLLPVVKTGQTKEYAPYDDSHYQQGVQRTFTRHTPSSGDYVEDSATNLMWQDTPMQAWVIEGWTSGLPDISDEHQVSQASANSYCQSATTGGYSDWRLPTVHELRTIVNYSVYSHANYRNEFKNLSGWTYLTASKYQQTFYKNLIKHRGIFGCDGRNVLYDADDVYEDGEKIISGVKVGDGAYVRCTRGTTLKTDHDDGRFTRSSSGKTLTDTYTNLEWQDHYVGGFDDNGAAVDGSANKEWANSLGYCENLTLDGKSDWRVPNYNEQFSLIEEDKDNQWNMFNQGKKYSIYWSSTTYEKNNYGWSYSPAMRTFYFAKKDRINNTAVRCIRGGE